MALIIPKKGEKARWTRDFKVDGNVEKYLQGQQVPQANPPIVPTQPLNVNANINRANYIQIPGKNVLIAKSETYKGSNWTNTHSLLAGQGLFMPTPELFLPYFLSVRSASNNGTKLYDGNNQPIAQNEVNDLWKYLTTNFNGGCWTWLDAKFKEQNGAWSVETDTRVNSAGIITSKSSPLENCIREDCFVTLDFNSQGLPKTKHWNQKYKQGESIYFYQPRKDAVAWFLAGSDWAYLDCGGDPSGTSDGLGVFACAEGTRRLKFWS